MSGLFWVDVPVVRQESRRIGEVAEQVRAARWQGAASALLAALPGVLAASELLGDVERDWDGRRHDLGVAADALSGALDACAFDYEGVDAAQRAELERAAWELKTPRAVRVTVEGRVLESGGGI